LDGGHQFQRAPAFAEVESDVKTAWLGEQKAQAWRKAYATMRPYIERTLEGESCSFEATLSGRGAAPRHTRVTFSPRTRISPSSMA
jgi:hypothetical protein